MIGDVGGFGVLMIWDSNYLFRVFRYEKGLARASVVFLEISRRVSGVFFFRLGVFRVFDLRR